MSVTRLCSLALMLSLLASTAHAKINNPSKHRKIKGGVGNCIFSASPLPYLKEGQFKGLSTSFDESTKRVYARCYYPKVWAEYEKRGKVGSSLRTGSPPEYYAYFWGSRGYKRATFKYRTARDGKKDQTYFYLGGSSGCDVCGDLAKLAKETVKPYQIKAGKKSHTQKICAKVYFLYADTKKWVVVRGRREHHFVNKEQPVAEGCFDYTVKL